MFLIFYSNGLLAEKLNNISDLFNYILIIVILNLCLLIASAVDHKCFNP